MFKNLKLSAKLGASFGILVLLFVVVSAVVLTRFNLVYDKVEVSEAMNDIRSDILSLRRHEKDFMLRADNKYITKHADLASQTTERCDELGQLFSHKEDRAKVEVTKQAFLPMRMHFRRMLAPQSSVMRI